MELSTSNDRLPLSFWVESLGFAGGAIGMVQGIPQAVRIYRLGSGYGVSLSAWWLMLVKMAAWSGYGIIISSPSVIISNAIGAATSALVVVALLGWGHRAWLFVIPVIGAIMIVVQFLPGLVTTVILFLLTLARVPQLVVSWMNFTRGIPTAVSISTLVFGIASMTCWGVYGVLVNDAPLIWTTVLALLLTVSTSWLEFQTNATSSRDSLSS